NPGEFTSAYLSRVAECYIRDMRPELAVMCRAVLDTAIQQVADDEQVKNIVGAGRRGHVGLERRIEFCRSCGIFDDEVRDAAERVMDAGDKAAHVVPGLERDPDG